MKWLTRSYSNTTTLEYALNEVYADGWDVVQIYIADGHYVVLAAREEN